MRYLFIILLTLGCSKEREVKNCKDYCLDANAYSISRDHGICSCIYVKDGCKLVIEQ